jgi:hypothetical protein
MGLDTLIRLLQEGDPVKAGGVNRPLRDLDQNVRYLWDVIQAAGLGSTVYAHAQTVEPAAVTGMAVWFNPSAQRFERGLAVASADQSGVVTTSAQAQVWGVVASKSASDLAEILLFGTDAVDVSQAVSGPVSAGTYYLSGVTPGMLTRQKPPVSVAVLRADGLGRVFVMPQFVDFLDRHTHYKFPLTCLPAGTTSPPAPGGFHVITDANPLLPGWLPAVDPSFRGLAPHGAVFGYNMAAAPALQNAWPPAPLSGAYLEWDRAADQNVGSTGVPLGPGGLCLLDRNGIWWLSDCYGDAPWPTLFDSANPVSASGSWSAPGDCPRPLLMAMTLWFTRVNFATEGSAVTSLRSGDGRIRVHCLGTDRDASGGDLELVLDLDLTVAGDADGYLVLKTFDPSKGQFQAGPVCEGVYPLTQNVTLTSPRQRRLVPGDAASPTVFQGPVGLAVAPQQTSELDVQLVRLEGAEEQNYQDVMYLGLPAGEATLYRAKIKIPDDAAVANPVLTLRLRLLGRGAGTLPALTLTGRRVPRPSAGPAALPTASAEFPIVCDTRVVLTAGNQYAEVGSTPFPVAAGDTVLFTVARGAGDGYLSEVGVLHQAGIVTPGG